MLAQASTDVECPLPAGADSISCLAWNPAGNMLVAGGWDGKARVWEVQRQVPGGAPVAAAARAEVDVGGPILDVTWRDDSSVVVVGCARNGTPPAGPPLGRENLGVQHAPGFWAPPAARGPRRPTAPAPPSPPRRRNELLKVIRTHFSRHGLRHVQRLL